MTALEQMRADAELGAAWRRCEAALPSHRGMELIVTPKDRRYYARIPDEGVGRPGPTPAAALNALAEVLARQAAD